MICKIWSMCGGGGGKNFLDFNVLVFILICFIECFENLFWMFYYCCFIFEIYFIYKGREKMLYI